MPVLTILNPAYQFATCFHRLPSAYWRTIMLPLRLILVDPDPLLCKAWHTAFAALPNVAIVNGYFEQLPVFDCMVSAANSFGLMDGGVDAAIVRFFGVQLESRVQQRVAEEYVGEQPVGTSIIVETGHPQHPFIAHTPTMRVPMAVTATENPYLAMWGLLVAIHGHNRAADQPIVTVACPGLATATGRVPAPEAARQMAVAYRFFLQAPGRIDWQAVMERHRRIQGTWPI